jgi:hypothetical protein
MVTYYLVPSLKLPERESSAQVKLGTTSYVTIGEEHQNVSGLCDEEKRSPILFGIKIRV